MTSSSLFLPIMRRKMSRALRLVEFRARKTRRMTPPSYSCRSSSPSPHQVEVGSTPTIGGETEFGRTVHPKRTPRASNCSSVRLQIAAGPRPACETRLPPYKLNTPEPLFALGIPGRISLCAGTVLLAPQLKRPMLKINANTVTRPKRAARV